MKVYIKKALFLISIYGFLTIKIILGEASNEMIIIAVILAFCIIFLEIDKYRTAKKKIIEMNLRLENEAFDIKDAWFSKRWEIMSKNNVYAQILYRGFVCEKGRVYTELWKCSYRRILKIQVNLWRMFLIRMADNVYGEEDVNLMNYFIKLCKDEKQIGKYYAVQVDSLSNIDQNINSSIEIVTNNKEDIVIINFMNELVSELTDLLKHKIFVDKKRIHMIIRVLHNLPRYFLGNAKTLTDKLKDKGIDFHSAIGYSFSNMDIDMKNRYKKYNIRE